MSEPLATILAIVLGIVAIVAATAFFSVFRAGPNEIAVMRRKGFGIWAWFSGSLPAGNRGTTASELEGLEMKAVNGQLVWARRTRTPSSETI